MTKETKNNDHPERGICEQFVYLPNSVAYLNSSDMNELAEIPHAALGIFKNMEEIILRR